MQVNISFEIRKYLKYVYSDWIESFWIIHVSDGTIFQNLNMECEK